MALRCAAHASFLARLRTAAGTPATADPPPAGSGALNALSDIATVVGDGEQRRYVPSRAARDRVAGDLDGSWPKQVAGRHRKAFRRSDGAIFRLPVAGSADDAETSPVEVFITDFSPCPAACAVAVHPQHPLGCALPDGTDAAFTGRFCRHPLTGDLLPVWTAAWVKPEFGTGAVLVNPAHDAADLAFARRVGLPVRFALAPEDDPQAWQEPPVVRTGVAVRTGATDGLDVEQARAAYFEAIAARGLAETYVDNGVGAFPVATGGEHGTPRAVLALLDPRVRDSLGAIVAPGTAVDTDLLAARLLLAETGATDVPEVVLVGPVSGDTDGVDPDVLALTLLVAAAGADSVPVKPQTLETSERFLANHARILALAGQPGGEPPKAAAQIRSLLERRDTKQAFTQLYRLQKELVKEAAPTAAKLDAYAELAHLLAGVPARTGSGTVATT